MLKKTPFHDFHVSCGAKLVDFAGWEMPLYYRGIVEEHVHTRQQGSVFDVSHMGRVYFSGRDAAAFLDRMLTRNLADQQIGQSRYSMVCNEQGGVLDDVIASRDQDRWLVVCNASNREKLLGHFNGQREKSGMEVTISDETEQTAMMAVQGPTVIDRMQPFLPVDLRGLKRYRFVTANLLIVKLTIFRSGYTGEDGVEVIFPASFASTAIRQLGDMRSESLLQPAGLGARDTLRLEAGMPLYGHELSESIDPISAGLGWAVDLSKPFVGRDALKRIADEGPRRKLVGLEFEGRRIARQGMTIQKDGEAVGEITSGTFGPTVQKSIAMGFVDSAHAGEGTDLAVDLKGTAHPARVVSLPFYKRA